MPRSGPGKSFDTLFSRETNFAVDDSQTGIVTGSLQHLAHRVQNFTWVNRFAVGLQNDFTRNLHR